MYDYTAKENQALSATQKRHKTHIFFEGGRWKLCCYRPADSYKDTNVRAYSFVGKLNRGG